MIDSYIIFFRYTLAYAFGNLLEKDLNSFVSEWNDHPIRKNLQSSSPHGCPNDIYDIPSLNGTISDKLQCHILFYFLGTTDQLQPIDSTLWAHCMLYESIASPPLCPESFKDICEDVLHDTLNLSPDDITHANCRNIYLQLVNSIKILVSNGLFWM